MKVAVVACLHGNVVGLEAVIQDAEARKAEQIVVLGDLLGGHPDHSALFDLVRKRGDPVVAGVLDQSALDDLSDAKAMGDNPFSRAFLWAAERLTAEEKAWLAGLPKTHVVDGGDSGKLVVCHNSPLSLTEKIDWTTTYDTPQFEERFRRGDARVIARANLHGQFAVTRGPYTAVNVGSGGLPVDNDPRAGYALFESVAGGWRVDLLRVPYDYDKAAQRITDSGMPDGEARAQLTRTGRRAW
ncbi:MAG TPA: metallophosphoesterase family protein [Thermoplasmata archaeon]|nr:metallophosphoesterase family protein [Thermoplasmata archaeon]